MLKRIQIKIVLAFTIVGVIIITSFGLVSIYNLQNLALTASGNVEISNSIAQEIYMFALLVGSCLGGNLTPFGASANIVAMGILKKEGYPVNFGGFLKISAPFTVLTTAAAAAVLWIIWA